MIYLAEKNVQLHICCIWVKYITKSEVDHEYLCIYLIDVYIFFHFYWRVYNQQYKAKNLITLYLKTKICQYCFHCPNYKLTQKGCKLPD